MASRAPRQGAQPMSLLKRTYLIAYNALNTALWAFVLIRTLQALIQFGPEGVYPVVGSFTKWTQTLAALEIVHSLLRVVRAPLLTTLMQVASRFALVRGAVHFYPEIAYSAAYSSMLIAWSTTEVIRYAFFALVLAGTELPALQWLRYSGFYVLYPVGISSELYELLLAFFEARASGPAWAPFVIAAVMVTYGPGAPILYGHMMKQRRKVLGRNARVQ